MTLQCSREDRKKYEPLCNLAPPDKRLFFTPFVLESSETGIYQYFVKSLSCVLQKANASNINKRSHEIITGVHALDYTTAYRATYFQSVCQSVGQSVGQSVSHLNFKVGKTTISVENL